MNLLHKPWLPVRRRDGSREWIAPDRLSDPDIVGFDADRADFNGALAQFAIGLLQTTTPMDSPIVWKQLFANPPDAVTLKSWFAPVTAAFEFDGDGARFMQDTGLKNGSGKTQGIAGLLIESPGNNALENNTDHFVKRGAVEAMCDRCAAAALFTLQTNAPEGGGGGGGKFTGIRGGGPLTTLVVCQPRQSLWQDLWLNVRERSVFLSLPGDSSRSNLSATFPWLETQSLPMGDNRLLTPVQIHPAHVFWAMPRRIRVDFATVRPGKCGICQEHSSHLVGNYADATGGFNYKEKGLWDHPLSPYREQARAGWQPVHPRGPIGYRHWLALVAGSEGKNQRPAKVVNWCVEMRHRVLRGRLRLWAFGYDMDSAKPQCWYESTLPLYGLADCEPSMQKEVEAEVANWIAAADLASRQLTVAVKSAWFSESATKKWKADIANAFAARVTAQLWSRTEKQFYDQLNQQIELVRNTKTSDQLPVREEWLRHVAGVAISLFDEDIVGSGPIERQNPRRVARAFQNLKYSRDGRGGLFGSEMRQTLGLPNSGASSDKANKSEGRGTKRTAAT